MDFDQLLFPVFDALRRHGAPVGISEYIDAVKAARAGFGMEDQESLKRFCSLMWAKSRQDREVLEVIFEEKVAPVLEASCAIPKDKRSGGKAGGETARKHKEKVIGQALVNKKKGLSKAKAMAPEKPSPGPGTGRPYHMTPRLCLDDRQMASAFRNLRLLQQAGPPEDLDIPATLKGVCKTGKLIRPVLKPRRRNQASLLLLMDRRGSMAPFGPFVERLENSIRRGGLLGKVETFFFHDCPESFLFETPKLANPFPLDNILDDRLSSRSVLIVSDAGAARGFFDKMRILNTGRFLKKLFGHAHRLAWLNPVPRSRWKGSSAEKIAGLAPMFSPEPDDFKDMVKALKGRGGRRESMRNA